MRKRRLWGWLHFALIVALLVFGSTTTTMAQSTSSSNNYQITESEFGGGSGEEACSESYCARASIGDPGAASSRTSAEFGEIFYDEPLLQVIVEPGNSNLGVLSTETTAT